MVCPQVAFGGVGGVHLPLRILLKAFLRIFALALNKTGNIKDFGRWIEDKWTWKMQLRRQLFDWEREQWKCFLAFLDNIAIRRLIPDTIAGSFDLSGMFTVRSFSKNLESLDSLEAMGHCDIWQDTCLPKVEVFAWSLMRGRILAKKVLTHFGFNVPSGIECSLCKSGVETIDHLFLSYSWTWRPWMGCMGWWSVVCCSAASIKAWWKGWKGLCPSAKQERA
ncbi:hypothetical protein Dsin_000059 [Dipteronia sinensis]|uniref:Reverse transcriptase zinc-binding domain-containing protein n=1 Tax=Dipteronia sinensis TaxID=43782 RepID=A0AAD9Z0V0_9ROSI|nr:hypothetical protein Dsin_000059 [Dipteronia sinensis]